MLGIHDHSKNVHTSIEILATFSVILATALSINFGLTQSLPSMETLYSNLLTAVTATGAFYGYNTVRASATNKKATQAAKTAQPKPSTTNSVQPPGIATLPTAPTTLTPAQQALIDAIKTAKTEQDENFKKMIVEACK